MNYGWIYIRVQGQEYNLKNLIFNLKIEPNDWFLKMGEIFSWVGSNEIGREVMAH